ncbi:hypothetical protein BDL97_02G029300 [Sphagnum fallax]|nr:hypothetical protein BDL97_02G029300 [Sphagnum fallax]KAH8969352.1 hypothetical protein BDL97_02G029300 [Sphagnum fallax]
MAVLGKSGLLAVSDSCWLNNLQLPTTETDRAYRISTSSPCSSNCCGSCTYSSIQQNPISGVETRRPAKWPGKVNLESLFPSKRLHSRGRWSVGTARAGMDEGGQTVTPAVTPGADLSMLHGQMLIQLQLQLDIATEQEDYKEAARLRDMIKALECEDPVLRLKIMMEKAIAEEQYADAARYRDELNRLAPQKDHTGLKCFSDITTEGIRVRVRSVYVRDRSQPCKQQYFFAYRIRISNEGFRSVQLLSRHWIITDAAGKIEHVRGLGVTGQQPVLLPGTSFEYTSACPLSTSTGRMEGAYQMKYTDEKSLATFDVEIAPFSLSVNGDD